MSPALGQISPNDLGSRSSCPVTSWATCEHFGVFVSDLTSARALSAVGAASLWEAAVIARERREVGCGGRPKCRSAMGALGRRTLHGRGGSALEAVKRRPTKGAGSQTLGTSKFWPGFDTRQLEINRFGLHSNTFGPPSPKVELRSTEPNSTGFRQACAL